MGTTAAEGTPTVSVQHLALRLPRGDDRDYALADPSFELPADNAYIEAFNGRFRAECPNAHWFLTLADAAERMKIGADTTTRCVRMGRSGERNHDGGEGVTGQAG